MVTRRLRFLAATLAVVVPLLAVASVAFPALYVHPFKPQSPEGLSWALSVRDASPRLTIVLAAVAVLAAATLWRGSRRLVKVGLGLSVMLASATVALSRFNQFEAMFAPLPQPTFAKVSDVDYLEPGDAVLAVEDQGDAVAFPVRLLAFHHVVHADVGGESVVATYCTLCHAGLVWRSTLDGRALTFRLSGINNQNMMMKDE